MEEKLAKQWDNVDTSPASKHVKQHWGLAFLAEWQILTDLLVAFDDYHDIIEAKLSNSTTEHQALKSLDNADRLFRSRSIGLSKLNAECPPIYQALISKKCTRW
ncbi:uncharacterized protein MCYG_01520 [Microsporum canis CBS 113480]|uniref:Uncharacterized protein n=1 Tax=Arthroderma otae (strain ATCC MYA-4605 / CBS 113480) TaxID=554155 RepID=C5FHG1_ARTOC|nr:uncharacterized protein MCYG_01520 [Microsporum canis CBS 113480]EEQ28701.1 predicted protein [Microsporum canis CBS 113480]